MKITFIGTASGLSVIDRSHASLMVEFNGAGFLIDCGEGTTRSLLMNRIEPNRIGKIVISHTHPDHCSGIPVLMQYMYLSGRRAPLEVWLPAGAGEAFRLYFNQLYLLNEKLSYNFDIKEYSEGVLFLEGGISVRSVPNRHLVGYADYASDYGIGLNSFSLTFSEGAKRVYYSADLLGAEDFRPPPGTDLMIVECTHIAVEEAAAKAVAAGASRVIFTHIPPETNTSPIERERVKLEFAFDGMEVVL